MTGKAISLVSADEVDLLSGIERLIQRVLPREEAEGFEPDQMVKLTTLNRPVRANRPRRPLKSETNVSNNSRHSNNSTRSKERSNYGQGPQPGNKAKSGGRHQTERARPAGDNSSRQTKESGGNRVDGQPPSPYAKSLTNETPSSGRRRPSGGNSNRGSGRSRTR